jgi:hypothetical protein
MRYGPDTTAAGIVSFVVLMGFFVYGDMTGAPETGFANSDYVGFAIIAVVWGIVGLGRLADWLRTRRRW